MNWHTFALYVATEAALSLSPGPAVMMVVACGLARGARRSIAATLGILTANGLYFGVSATGLGALLVASYEVFATVKWVGAAYLVYLGLSAVFGKASPVTLSARRPERDGWRTYLGGLTLQLANPKALLFFVAILPQFVDPHVDVRRQMVWLALGSVLPEFCILCAYGWLAGRAGHAVVARPRWARLTDRVAGALLLCAAAMVAAVRRS